MTQPFGPLDPLTGGVFYVLSAIALLSLCLGTPVIVWLTIRFLYYRHVYVGRSAELEKLIWQLHRIASALESDKQPTTTETLPRSEKPHKSVHLSMFGR